MGLEVVPDGICGTPRPHDPAAGLAMPSGKQWLEVWFNGQNSSMCFCALEKAPPNPLPEAHAGVWHVWPPNLEATGEDIIACCLQWYFQ